MAPCALKRGCHVGGYSITANIKTIARRPKVNNVNNTMSYKEVKEAFHADNPGSSVHYINAVSVTALVSCFYLQR